MSWFDWTQKIDLLAFDQGVLTFQSDKRLKSQMLKVECRLFTARLRVLQEIAASPLLEGRVEALGYPLRAHIYAGELEQPDGAEHLAALLDPLQAMRRREPRVPLRFKVLSRDLPGYWALACDISMSGVGLTTVGSEPLPPRLRGRLERQLEELSRVP